MSTLRVGLIADTHGLLRPEATAFLAGCDHIIHAGDVGDPGILDALAAIAPLTAICGNVDTDAWARRLTHTAHVTIGGVPIYVLHDLKELDLDPAREQIRVVVSGHSHKPVVSERGGVLYVNPGSAGPRRFVLPVTAAELIIDGDSATARIPHPDFPGLSPRWHHRGAMTRCRLDHLVVTAVSLDAGCDFVEACLGVRPGPGGEHPRMGTHNRLLRLGDATYLEVIAVNPNAEHPGRPRWFGLDDLAANAPPRLAGWVARTDDIDEAVVAAGEPLGRVEPMSRGSLQWRIAIPEEGRLPLAGLAPALIQWETATHPAASMPDAGCSLVGLALRHHEPQRITALLTRLGVDEPSVTVSAIESHSSALVARIETPAGLKVLGR